jgi:hypothetical protein
VHCGKTKTTDAWFLIFFACSWGTLRWRSLR